MRQADQANIKLKASSTQIKKGTQQVERSPMIQLQKTRQGGSALQPPTEAPLIFSLHWVDQLIND
jgi:hypothetical protein